MLVKMKPFFIFLLFALRSFSVEIDPVIKGAGSVDETVNVYDYEGYKKSIRDGLNRSLNNDLLPQIKKVVTREQWSISIKLTSR